MADSLKRLKKQLYGKNKELSGRFEEDSLDILRARARKKEYSSDWSQQAPKKRKSMPKMTKLIIILAFFVVIILTASLIYLFGGFGFVSSDQIEFNVSGPTTIAGGDKVTWRLHVKNNNEVPLEHAEIAFEYPPGSRPVSDSVKTQNTQFIVERQDLGTVGAGEYVDETFEAFVFGEEDKIYQAKATLEYRIAGSNALLAKEVSSDVKILQSPIGVSVHVPKNINIGQEIEVEVVFSSNSPKETGGLVAKIDYPDGFEFLSASPAPSLVPHTWEISKMAPKEEKSIIIKGKLRGDNLANKIFKATIGVRENQDSLTVYGAGVGDTVLKQPFLDIGLKVNGANDYIATSGENLEVSILWKNNLPIAVKNAILEVGMVGAALDYSRVTVSNGSYRGQDKTIVWNASSYPTFSFIQPGQEGELKFRVNTLNNMPVESFSDKNFQIKFNAHMYLGERPEGFAGIDIDGRAEANIKVASDLQLSQRGYFYSGVISNSGPMPPQVGKETTYTIVWSLTNSSNDLRNVKISAALPAYVVWKNNISPAGEEIKYDSVNGKVEWTIDKLSAGTGLITKAREVAFQIGIIPSSAQVGSSPTLISEVTAEGDDTFTGITLTNNEGEITTRLFTDPQTQYFQYQVVK